MDDRYHAHLPRDIYPPDEWRLVETRFDPRRVGAAESLFTTANGYLGLRGTCDEGQPVEHNGTYVNGFHETWPIVYGEEAYGFAKQGQTIVDLPDAKIIRLYVDDEPFFLPTATLERYERVLDMRAGTLDRTLVWAHSSGQRVSIRSRRLVSLEHRHLAAISYEVTLLAHDAPVVIVSEIAASGRSTGANGDPRTRQFGCEAIEPQVSRAADRRIVFGYATRSSGMTLACAVDHELRTDCDYTTEVRTDGPDGRIDFSIDGQVGARIHLVKYVTYHSSRRPQADELCERADRLLNRAVRRGFAALLDSQRQFLTDFWNRSDVVVKGQAEWQQTIRFNLFHICQATARTEGGGVPAKGLTGPGYEGHYFWDTEIYLLPFLTYTTPRIAQNLLRQRHGHLDEARRRARELNQRGALFPWRTIDGNEASAYYAAGTAQYHINADIVYALRKYVDVTGDTRFLAEVGAEILVETARLWIDLGFFDRHDGRFRINGVTGPDEYNAVVNNNLYTNLMARENLWYAAATIRALRADDAPRFKLLVRATGVDPGELDAWQRAADHMYLPFDERDRVHLQDDSFKDKEDWDFEHTPPDKYPLLLHYHPLVIYRHRVVKQADVVLAMFLLGQEFSLEQKRRNFVYYDALTTRDSSLSCSIESIVAAEVGEADKAYSYSLDAGFMDLADVAGNVQDGCHIASMGGFWMTLIYGFAGMRDDGGRITFSPQVPPQFESLRFPLQIRGWRLEVELTPESATYLLRGDEPIVIGHRDETIELQPDVPVTRPSPAGAPATGVTEEHR
jgi:alpha,alpha-trehalose phosphorylase